MQQQVIKVEPRSKTGKGNARKVRKQGHVPAVLYGHKEAPQPLMVDPRVLTRSVSISGAGRNTVFKVEGLERTVLALLKDLQFDPVKHRLIHVDFIEVRETDEVAVEVPVVFKGKPVGVVNGGILQPVRRSLRVFVNPLAIPKEIDIDTSHLDIGDSIHIRDVQFPQGARAADGGHLAVAILAAPTAEEAKPADEAAAAAPAAAAGAAAAAPAEKEKKG